MEFIDSKGEKSAACDWCSRRAPWTTIAPGPVIEKHWAAICVDCAQRIVSSFTQMIANEKAKAEAEAKRKRRGARNKAAAAATAAAAAKKAAPAKRAKAAAPVKSAEKPKPRD